MDQVSPPMRIVLVVVVLLAAAWFTVLKPKADDGSAASPASAVSSVPGVSGLQSAVDKAKDAVASANPSAATRAAADATASAARVQAAKIGKAKAKAKAADVGDPSPALLAQTAKGKVVALLFAQPGGADDASARTALRRLTHSDPRVISRVVPITEVGRYQAVTTGVEIVAAPTIVLIGKGDKALSVTGYTEVATLRQLVGDLRRAAKQRP